jgi:HK97 family phage major capsid protein
MKLTKREKHRLAVLSSKAADKLTAAEKSELAGLTLRAKAQKIEVTDSFKTKHKDEPAADDATADEPDDDASDEEAEEGLTEKQLTDIIQKAVGSKVSAEDIAKEVAKALTTADNKAPSLDEITKAITDTLAKSAPTLDDAGITKLTDAVKAALPKEKAISQEDIAKIVDARVKEATKQKHFYAIEDGERVGNLSVADKQLLNICLKKDMNEGIPASTLKAAEDRGNRVIDGMHKALTTTTANNGLELIPTDLSSTLLYRMTMESELTRRLLATEIIMPSNPFKFPLRRTRTAWRKGVQGTAGTASNPTTDGLTLDAAKFIAIAEYTAEAEEDAIVAMLPMLQTDLSAGGAAAFESAVLNGDTTGTHQDSDTTDSEDVRKNFKGLRKYALAGSLTVSFASGGISAANMHALIKKLGKWGVKASDLLFVLGSQGYHDVVDLPETLTADKAGAAARIITGNAPSLYGVPIITSEAVREDLNASGVYDGSVTTKGSVYLLHLPSWVTGVRRAFKIETDFDKKSEVACVVASYRRDFKPMETPSATLKLCAMGFNYTVG